MKYVISLYLIKLVIHLGCTSTTTNAQLGILLLRDFLSAEKDFLAFLNFFPYPNRISGSTEGHNVVCDTGVWWQVEGGDEVGATCPDDII